MRCEYRVVVSSSTHPIPFQVPWYVLRSSTALFYLCSCTPEAEVIDFFNPQIPPSHCHKTIDNISADQRTHFDQSISHGIFASVLIVEPCAVPVYGGSLPVQEKRDRAFLRFDGCNTQQRHHLLWASDRLPPRLRSLSIKPPIANLDFSSHPTLTLLVSNPVAWEKHHTADEALLRSRRINYEVFLVSRYHVCPPHRRTSRTPGPNFRSSLIAPGMVGG
jgi:hypothetical protein